MYGVMVDRAETDEINEWLQYNGLKETFDWMRSTIPGASKMRISFRDEDNARSFASKWAAGKYEEL